MKIYFNHVGAVRHDGSQLFSGTTIKGYLWTAKFTKHLLVISHAGEESTFLAQEGWETSEKKRRELIEEFFSLK